MELNTDIAIIGAGPYGLSLAAHLSASRADFRIYGGAMRTWIEAMPTGMLLKSEGFASDLFDPDRSFTLEHYCAEQGLPYEAVGLPVPLETFIAYGQAFQRRFAPDLEDRILTALDPANPGFRLTFADGGQVHARRVVIASGIRDFSHIPDVLARLPDSALTHSSRYGDLSPFKDREVMVVGAGASALDLAALLAVQGASPRVVTRAKTVRFHTPPGPRRWKDRLARPMTGLGPGWKSFLSVHAPLVFHAMPQGFRLDVVKRHLGPAPGWFVRQQVEGRVPLMLGQRITEAGMVDGRARLVLADDDGGTRSLTVDHVIAATGYRADLARLTFLAPTLRASIRLTGGAPAVNRHFESSAPGLYFVGASVANSFGPLLRFAFGAGFAARRVCRHLTTRAVRSRGPMASAPYADLARETAAPSA